MDACVLETPGKVNLFLEIKGKRADLRHEILTLFYPVDTLCDRVELDFGGETVRIRCSEPGVPLNQENLAVKAAGFFFEAAGMTCPGLEIRLEKHLPVAGGMGGGSSDAGAVLRLLQQNSGVRLPDETLFRVALKLGSDVPFFLNPVSSIGRGGGELLTEVELPDRLPLLLIPGVFPISAAWGYRHWNDVPQTNQSSLDDLLNLLRAGEFRKAGRRLRNDLEPAALRKFPLLKRFSELFRESGGAPLMSGSGSTLFGLYSDFTARDRAFDFLQSELKKYNAALIKP